MLSLTVHPSTTQQQESRDCTPSDQQCCRLQQQQLQPDPAENGALPTSGEAAEGSGPAAGQADDTQPPPAKRIRIKLGSRGAFSLPGEPRNPGAPWHSNLYSVLQGCLSTLLTRPMCQPLTGLQRPWCWG